MKRRKGKGKESERRTGIGIGKIDGNRDEGKKEERERN
jgi:hypothetical protein